MDWSPIFSTINIVAMIAWAALILLPRWPALLSGLLYLVVGGLSGLYAFLFAGAIGGFLPPGEVVMDGSLDFSSIAGVRGIFGSDLGVMIGWAHYLAFDLFVGLWIARDGDAKGISRIIQAPILFATFFAGPIGLFVWLIVREPIARRQGRFT